MRIGNGVAGGQPRFEAAPINFAIRRAGDWNTETGNCWTIPRPGGDIVNCPSNFTTNGMSFILKTKTHFLAVAPENWQDPVHAYQGTEHMGAATHTGQVANAPTTNDRQLHVNVGGSLGWVPTSPE